MEPFVWKILDNGRLPEGAVETLKWVIPTFAGKKVSVSIAEKHEGRSLPQNDFYWKAIVRHVRQMRFDGGDPVTVDKAHEDLLAEFAPHIECKRLDGSIYTRPMRSKEMSVKQMADYCTAITAAMASFGSPIVERNAV